MMPVRRQPPPDDFADKVTEKAKAFLKENPFPTAKEIRSNHLWRDVLPDLHEVFDQVCAYSSLWCPLDMATVDHFVPVSALIHINPALAYDWENFRLASRSMNSEKCNFQDVLDPFLVRFGWFVMDFSTLMIKIGSGLSPDDYKKVDATIKRLKFNDKEKYFQYRKQFLMDYCDFCSDSDDIKPALRYLERKAPFIAYELKRQGLTKKIIHIMK
ncbi:MAG: hypothetical protein L0Y73_08010, partial [Candidatus Aminicenantes bacterium]|nr:hypothetical protein [Candidatus Aminicenantes bacterium]